MAYECYRPSLLVRFGMRKYEVFIGMDGQLWIYLEAADARRLGTHPGQNTVASSHEAGEWLRRNVPPSPERDAFLWRIAWRDYKLYTSLCEEMAKHGRLL